MDDMVIAQLHRTLVDAIRRNRPEAIDRPVTVAEIYQDLVPYRTARTTIGFEMNADYEYALLRLLAGEGDLARIEPREVRDKLRMELESPNPDVGLYRSYAACDVWVNVNEALPADDTNNLFPESWEEEFVGPSAPQPPSDPGLHEPEAEPEGDETADLFEAEVDAAPVPRAKPPFQIAAESNRPTEPAKNATRETVPCAFCGGELPADRMVNFCPFCGSDQSQQPCPSCGELLEPLWRFCVACGTRVQPAGDHLN
jgi:hypothetical protein